MTRDPFRRGSLWDRRPPPLTAAVIANHLRSDTEVSQSGRGAHVWTFFTAPVFLGGPISFPGLVIQAVGRALRRHAEETDVIVHDYLDPNVPILNAQCTRRRTAYRQMGFTD